MFHVAFDLDPVWYAQQLKLSRSNRPPGGTKVRKDRERVLVGYIDGVLILAFPYFEVSVEFPGTGEGWFSLNPYSLAEVVATFSGTVRLTVDDASILLGRFKQPHAGLAVRLGSADPELPRLASQIDELAAEHCYRRLLAAAAAEQQLGETLKWHRAEHAMNTTPLLERIRANTLIVYRRPDAPPTALALRAIVDSVHRAADRVLLHCHDFRGEKLTVDPRWVTLVGT